MIIYTPDGTELMSVASIVPHEDGIMIDGIIMGAMPMQGLVRPAELRALRKLVTVKLVWAAFTMLFKR
jgi:hypothetical protein